MTMLKNIKKTSLFFGICIAVVLLFGGVASAATYYVAPDGNDSYPGTEAQPWKTIQKAADTLTAGDTVYIKAGTYNEQVIPKNSGTPGNYSTYATYPGDTVTIDGDGISVYPAGLFRIEQKSYIKVSGFNIENYLGGGACHGIKIYYSDHIIIENIYVNNTGGCGIYARASCSNIIIDNNEVSYTNLDPDWDQEMISLSGTDTFVVKNNHVHHSDHIGIDAKGSSSKGEIYNNHVHDCDSGIYVDGCSTKPLHDIDVYNNVVHDCVGGGISLGTETGGALENISVYNNIAYNNCNGFQINNFRNSALDGSHMKTNIKVINNNFCDNDDSAILITDYGEHFQDLTIRNNILSGRRWGMINFPKIVEENVNIDHNLFTTISNVYGDEYITGDPEFVNPSDGNFHLQEDSPAIDNGLSVDAPGEDFDGNTRPQGAGYDIGAFEYVTAFSQGSDLVADWHLDEGTGVTAVDSSGNGNDGTLVNNPTWVNGKVGKGLSFDGTNDYVYCGLASSLKLTGAITVEAWVKWTGDGNPYFVTKFGGPDHRSYDLSGNDDGTVEFRVGGADCNILKSSGMATIPTGEWVYLVGTYEPSSYVRLFVNGVLAEEATTSIPASQGDNGLSWYIGAREGNQGWFNGVIDEVKIHNRALSAGEIMTNYEVYPSNRQPADLRGTYTGTEGVAITFDGSTSLDPAGGIVAYEWDFGDGNTATGVTPTHTYAQALTRSL